MHEQAGKFIDKTVREVNLSLRKLLPGKGIFPKIIADAVRYSVFPGGKRFRPVLMHAAASACLPHGITGKKKKKLLMLSAAIEMIHCSSLVHDDLPAMDDDDYRRGKLSTHKRFGEAIAILAGDALLFRAFEVISLAGECEAAGEIARASGYAGMVGGQAADMTLPRKRMSRKTIGIIHELKTGELIRVSLRCGGLAAGAGARKISALDRYGKLMGLCFQITDDILDGPGGDKTSFCHVYGVEGSKRMAGRYKEEAIGALAGFGSEADILRHMAECVENRKK